MPGSSHPEKFRAYDQVVADGGFQGKDGRGVKETEGMEDNYLL